MRRTWQLQSIKVLRGGAALRRLEVWLHSLNVQSIYQALGTSFGLLTDYTFLQLDSRRWVKGLLLRLQKLSNNVATIEVDTLVVLLIIF